MTTKKTAPATANPQEETPVEEQSDMRPTGSIRLEDGGFAVIGPDAEQKLFRQAALGVIYDHVSDHPSGDWVYRPTR